MTIGKVLVTAASIPNPKYGSWTQRITYLLEDENLNVFDAIISEKGETELANKNILSLPYVKKTQNPIVKKINPFSVYRGLKESLAYLYNQYDTVIFCIVDSSALKNLIWQYVVKYHLQKRTKIVYYQCGFIEHYEKQNWLNFIEGINGYIYLSKNAYENDLLVKPRLPFRVNYLHNPINAKLFNRIEESEKLRLRETKKITSQKVQFIWVSQDRPHKGLDVILKAWTLFSKDKADDVILNVVGARREGYNDTVNFIGRVSNAEVIDWVKLSDIGLFSPLWQEGFGLGLAEQMNCGLYCVTSNVGGIKEYFIDGVDGIAIDCPNIVDEWVTALEKAYRAYDCFEPRICKGKIFMDYEEWCQQFGAIINSYVD